MTTWWSALAVLALAACGEQEAGSDAGPDARPDAATCEASSRPIPPQVQPGEYRLEVAAADGWGEGAVARIEPDGQLTGHGWESLFGCEGTVTEAEATAIAEAFNAADVFRACSNPQSCFDHLTYAISAEGVGGEAAGWSNSLRYELCLDPIPELDHFVAAALAPIERLAASATCTACPTELDPGECYGAEFGSTYFCRDGAAHPCEASTADEVVDCGYRPSLQCTPDGGWVPAAVWWIEDFTLWRGIEEGTGYPRLFFLLHITVDNRGASPVELTDVVRLWRFLDELGDEMLPGEGSWGMAVPVIYAEGHSLDTYEMFMNTGTDPGSQILTVPSASVQIPERPWAGAPMAAPVPIDLREGSPY